MKKIIKVKIDKDIIDFQINNESKFMLSTDSNSINIKNLYEYLKPEKGDVFEVHKECKKIDKPKAFIDNLYNNTLIFVNELVDELCKVCIVPEDSDFE